MSYLVENPGDFSLNVNSEKTMHASRLFAKINSLVFMGLSKSQGESWLASGYTQCYGLNVCVPQNSSAEILIPNVIVLGGKTFRRCLGQENGGLMSGVNAVIK